MYAPHAALELISKRALALAAVVALVVAVMFATATSARQTIIHTHLGKAGTITVTGYDGGAPLVPKAP